MYKRQEVDNPQSPYETPWSTGSRPNISVFKTKPKFYNQFRYNGTASWNSGNNAWQNTSNPIDHYLGVRPAFICAYTINLGGVNNIYKAVKSACWSPSDNTYWVENLTSGSSQFGLGNYYNNDPVQIPDPDLLCTDTTFNPHYMTYNPTINPNGDYGVYAPSSTNRYDSPNYAGDQYFVQMWAYNPEFITSGTYMGNGQIQFIDCGFVPQWVLIKKISNSGGTASEQGWCFYNDNLGMGMHHTSASNQNYRIKIPHTVPWYSPDISQKHGIGKCVGGAWNSSANTQEGFQLHNGQSEVNQNGNTYWWMAIRQEYGKDNPAYATEYTNLVKGHFDEDTNFTARNSRGKDHGAGFWFGWVPDYAFIFEDSTSGSIGNYTHIVSDVLPPNEAYSIGTNNQPQQTNTRHMLHYYNNRFGIGGSSYTASSRSQNNEEECIGFKRQKGSFDLIGYRGNNGTKHLPHQLGVNPEMIIFHGEGDSDLNTGTVHRHNVWHKDTCKKTRHTAPEEVCLSKGNEFSLKKLSKANEYI